MSEPKIKHGFYNNFYVFKLVDTEGVIPTNQYIKILETLRDSGLIISAENQEKAVYHMDWFRNHLNERKKEYRTLKSEGKNVPAYLARSIIKVRESPRFTIYPTEKGIGVELEDNLIDDLDYSQTNNLHQLVDIYHDEEKYTGLATKNDKNRFLIFPPQLSIKEDEYFHPGLYLTLFKHGYAILFTTMEIEDFSFDEINMSMWNIILKSAYFPEFMINNNNSLKMKKKARCYSVNNMLREYGKYIYTLVNGEEPQTVGSTFYHLVLSDYTYLPDDYSKSMNDKLYETLFKLLFAPIPDYLLKPKEEMKQFVDKRFYSFSNHLRLFANNNRTVTAYTKSFSKVIKSSVPEDFDVNDPYLLNHLCQKSSLGGMINAIDSILLKKEATQHLSVFEIQGHTSLKKLIEFNIKENTNYAIEFSKYFYSYGSIRDLISFLEASCEDFLQTKLMDERRQKIEKVINLRKEQYMVKLAALGPAITIGLTLFLSFPALESILKSLNMEEHLFKIYVIVNLLFIPSILYLFKEQIKEHVYEYQNITKPKIGRFYLKSSTIIFSHWYTFSEFMNMEYKEAFKLIKLKLKQRFNRASSKFIEM